VSAHPEPPPGELLTYIRMLAGDSQPSQFFDLRYATPGGLMRQRFVSVLRIRQLAGRITALAGRADVYVGVALRDRAHGAKSAISGSHMLYIECDDPGARERVENFACSPSMIVASGSPGHLHVYWRLCEHASSAQVESTNRRLAVLLEGEPGCADIVRVLRPPTSLNHKHTPPVAVRLLQHNANARHALAELTASLPSDPQPSRSRAPRASRRVDRAALDCELLAIPAAEYVRVLANLTPNRAGKVLCPFHPESRPSLQLYPDGTFYCFGRHSKDRACRNGGTIFDFAAARWGLGTRGNDFLEVRRRLATTFGLTQPPDGGS
jgi:RepB DNA-primase N-terminal domain